MSMILVTGVPGWLGTRLARVLVEGLPDYPQVAAPDPSRRVRCLVRRETGDAKLPALGPSVELVEGDLRQPETLKAFFKDAEGATLFHCAGVIHPRARTSEFYDVNVTGATNLLNAAEAAGVRRAVMVSSNSPIGNNPSPTHRFTEDSPYNPYMNYGRSKHLMELAIKDVQARGKLQTVIVRPPWFYGPDQPPRQTLFFTMIKTGRAPILGDGGNYRSMVYIDNLCYGLLLCADTPNAVGQTYWIADERPYPMSQIVDTIERLLETDFRMAVAHKRMRLPFIVGEIATLVDGTIQGLGRYHQKIHVLSEMNKTIACAIGKAQRDLGYRPVIALEEGMRRSIRWCLDNGLTI